jgi:hypothetical protein
LCHGAITSAQRLRRAAWQSASEPPPSSATITSLRQIAAASTVTSHHSELLLRAAAKQAAVHFPAPETSQDMLRAADHAAAARASWLTLSRTLDRFTTQSQESLSAAAAEAPNLATWTGRLVYADPTWTIASGPAGQLRTADTLAPRLADIPQIIATVHHAATALEAAADAEHDQAQQTAKAGRLLVPTRSLARSTTTQALTCAPQSRVRDLLRACRAAGQASADTVTRLADIAASVDAPSRILTSASTAAGIDHDQRWRRVPDPIPATRPNWPGPLETSIRDLGVTSPWLIQRAVSLDRASAQLILDAAADAGPRHDGTAAATLSKSPTTAAIVNDLGARRRLRALAARSWSPQAIERATGLPALVTEAVIRSRRGVSRVNPALAGTVAAAYDQLWDRDPPTETAAQREAAEMTRAHAVSRGWAPPLAWDDDQIDLDDGQPAPEWKPGNRTTRRATDLVEDADFVRQNDGYRDASIGQIAMRLGVTGDCLEHAHIRARRYAARIADQGQEPEAEAC